MGAREGACTVAAQMPRPSTWRLIRNAAALAAASLTLLLNTALFNIIFLALRWHASVSRWACRKRRRKNSPCMRAEVLRIAGRKKRSDCQRIVAYSY